MLEANPRDATRINLHGREVNFQAPQLDFKQSMSYTHIFRAAGLELVVRIRVIVWIREALEKPPT